MNPNEHLDVVANALHNLRMQSAVTGTRMHELVEAMTRGVLTERARNTEYVIQEEP